MNRRSTSSAAVDAGPSHHGAGPAALALDLALMRRRRLIAQAGAAALALWAGEGRASGSCRLVPEETAGPFPANGATGRFGGGSNILAAAGVLRSDIRSSFGPSTTTAPGVPLSLRLVLVQPAGCAPLAGRAVYLWQCDREGGYSLYSSGLTGENYLRGVQVSDAAGAVTFTTVFPGCYPGRVPHLHFEVYRSLDTATSYRQRVRTSQIALPPEVCAAVYGAAAGYSGSAAQFSRISFASDMVFSDGVSQQLATVTGSVAAGFQAVLQVAVDA